MNAQQAREAAKVKTPTAIKQYSYIQYLIEKAAGQGDREIFTYESLVKGVLEMLQKDGFKVDQTMDRNDICNSISW